MLGLGIGLGLGLGMGLEIRLGSGLEYFRQYNVISSSITNRNIKGDSMQPCLTPVTIWNHSPSSPSVLTAHLLLLYRHFSSERILKIGYDL